MSRVRGVGGAAVALVVAALVAGARGETGVVVDLDSPPASSWLREVHYGVFRGEARVGWLRRALERSEYEGEPAVVRTVEQFVDVAGDGNAQISLERAAYAAAAPQELLYVFHRTERQGAVSSRRIVRRDGRFDVTTVRDGEEIPGAVAAFRLTLADELMLERLVAEAATREDGPVGATASARGIDVSRVGRLDRTLGVRGVTGDGAERLFEVALADAKGGWGEPMTVDAAGAIVTGALGGGLTLRRMSRDAARRTDDLTSIEETTRVLLDARLGDLETITELRLAVTGLPELGEGDRWPFPETIRQSLTPDGERHVLTVRRDADAGPVMPTERAAALAPSPRIDSDAASVIAAATRALSGSSQPPLRVARLLAFVAETVRDQAVLTEPSASEILRTPRGDCSEHARLFVALARAAGIPAREVTGLAWMGDDVRAFGRHAWAEVELAGRWREVDPTGGVLPAHAAHLRVTGSALLDGVTFELLEVVR